MIQFRFRFLVLFAYLCGLHWTDSYHEFVLSLTSRLLPFSLQLPVPTAAKAPAAAVPSCNSTHIEPELDAAPAPDREKERRDRQEQLLQQRQQELSEASARLEQSQRKLAKGTERFQRLAEQCEEVGSDTHARIYLKNHMGMLVLEGNNLVIGYFV